MVIVVLRKQFNLDAMLVLGEMFLDHCLNRVERQHKGSDDAPMSSLATHDILSTV